MLTSRNGGASPGYKKAFVCWTCQAKAHYRQLSSRAPDRHVSPNSHDASHRDHSSKSNKIAHSSERQIKQSLRRDGLGNGNGTSTASRRNAETWQYSSRRSYQTPATVSHQPNAPITFLETESSPNSPNVFPESGIRARLRQWNDLYGQQSPGLEPGFTSDPVSSAEPANSLARPEDSASTTWRVDEEQSVQSQGYYGHGLSEGDDDTIGQGLFLKMGDLVEISYPQSERESTLAVFVRRVSGLAQCYTITGRWENIREGLIPYSIPEWISPKIVEPILPYLPDAADLEDREALSVQAKMEDLAVPRVVAARIVERLLAFERESQEMYRRNASALDLAHEILAHDSDLRYGSLTSAATRLLNIAPEQLTAPAIYTVRKAISNAAFGFVIDSHSHRVTGYMQILPKKQVALVERVRQYIREWQEDSSIRSGMDAAPARKPKPSTGARIVNSYISKAKRIVLRSRETRTPTPHGVVSPSKVRLPLGPNNWSVKMTTEAVLTHEEEDITRFIEAWAVSGLFGGHPRLMGLGPLLLQATGLYSGFELRIQTGYMFLQELGAFLPYDNPRRFDPNLLLPTSQHSRPLQLLESRLQSMTKTHGFADTMAHLRHDWSDLPVYCIDGPNAKEIDDGLSVEPAETGPDGRQRHWVRVHIANPTAFFDKDSPFAKMARHMGETVYMPESTFPMLPNWVPRDHFSLDRDRPCLTISVKLDEDGAALEHKITSGIVRNVIRLTPDATNELLGISDAYEVPMVVLTVGGQVPPIARQKPAARGLGAEQVEHLRTLQRLAQKRLDMRKAGGGISFEIPRPEVNVYSSYSKLGLQPNNPWRRGWRITEGDPVIEYRTKEFRNWFDPQVGASDTLVREMMLLACEASAKWCAERDVPIVYRGTTNKPEGPTPAEFRRDVLVPQVGRDGEIPMRLGMDYMRTFGPSVLHSSPIRHDVMGMEYYTKATSPLRRYGDMILHWQIQAALLYEAETGRSLVDRPDADRSFLPFSQPALETIMRGLRPRERTVMLAKRYTERYWFLLLLMRRHYFGEDGGFPFETLRIMTTSDLYQNGGQLDIVGLCTDLNFYVSMQDPNRLGLGKARMGDVWECRFDSLDIYMQKCIVAPLRLLERPDI